MSLIEFSLKQLESWLASYCTPLDPMLLGLVVIGFSEDEDILVYALHYVPEFLFAA